MSEVLQPDATVRQWVAAFGAKLIQASEGDFEVVPAESGFEVRHQDKKLSLRFKERGVEILALSGSDATPMKPLLYGSAGINNEVRRWAASVSDKPGLDKLPISSRSGLVLV